MEHGYHLLVYFIIAHVFLCSSGLAVENVTDGDLRINLQLNVDGDTIETIENDTVSVTCYGSSDIKWETPTRTPTNPPKNLDLAEKWNVTTRKSERFDVNEATLTLTRIRWAGAGTYKCSYVDGSASVSLHIFVYSENELWDASNADGFKLRKFGPFNPAVVPFAVTHPNVSITLTLNGQKKETDEHFIYDPRIGYTIMNPSINTMGLYRGTATLGNKSSTRSVYMQFDASSAVDLQPELTLSKQRAMTGDTVWMKCSVKMPASSVVYMNWTYPPNANSTGRLVATHPLINHLPNGQETYTFLNISRTELIHNGDYSCMATNGKRSASERKKLSIYNLTFVYLVPEKEKVSVDEGQDSATLTFLVDAYPAPHYRWFYEKLDGSGRREIIIEDNKKYSDWKRAQKVRLQILLPKPEDAGRYTLQAHSRDMNASETITFHVNVKPKATLNPPMSPLYDKGKLYNIECDATEAYPSAKISWRWQPCEGYNCQPNPKRWQLLEGNVRSENKEVISAALSKSTLQFRMESHTIYQCLAENKLGNDTKVAWAVAKEFQEAFAMDRQTYEGVERDSITLGCHANRIHYSLPNILVVRNNIPKEITNTSRITVTRQGNKFTNRVFVKIVDLEDRDKGTYVCQAFYYRDGTQDREAEVVIIDAQVPSFETNMDDLIENIPIGQSNHVLTCKAKGPPQPSISWYKDGERLVIPDDQKDRLHFTPDYTVFTISEAVESDSGRYMCVAQNWKGAISSNYTLTVGALPTGLSEAQIGIIVAVMLIVIIVVAVLLFLFLRRYLNRHKINLEDYLGATARNYNPDIPVEEQLDCVAYDQRWEFPKENLHFGKVLGQGAFGKVLMAGAIDIAGKEGSTTVAVKMPRDGYDHEQVKALLSELKVLIHIGNHLNVLNLLGAVTKEINNGILYVIVEYCTHGSLRNYLLEHRTNFVNTMDDLDRKVPDVVGGATGVTLNPVKGQAEYMNIFDSGRDQKFIEGDGKTLTTKDLICFAFQIARGMEYLASRKYVHRDLAARNVLVAEDNVMKIADFGLAKDTYKYDFYKKKSSGPVPVKWMALESLTHRIYTTKSDVWSYGVLLWELFSMGGSPYPGMDLDEHFVNRIREGYRMEQPTFASDDMYAIMKQCWEPEVDDRPSFTDLADRMGQYLHTSVRQHYIDLNNEYKKDGYLAMEGSTEAIPSGNGYMKMRPSLFEPGEEIEDNTKDQKGSPKKRSKKAETGDDLEKVPMLHMVDETHPPPVPPDSPGSDTEGYLEPAAIEADPKKVKPSFITNTNSSVTANGPSSSQQSHFLGGGRTRSPVKPRTRPNQPKVDSVASDTSSGFHSDYIPEDSVPPEYNAVMKGIYMNQPNEYVNHPHETSV